MAKVVLLVSLFFFSNVFASDCYEIVTQSYSYDSVAFELDEFDIPAEYQPGSEQYAKIAVRVLEEKLGCEVEEELSKSIFSYKCKRLDKELEYSKVCFVTTSYGYYFVMIDMMGKVNLVFNRYD
jgi:hypothetical protein